MLIGSTDMTARGPLVVSGNAGHGGMPRRIERGPFGANRNVIAVHRLLDTVAVVALAAGLCGCAGAPPMAATPIRICAAQQCTVAGQRYTDDQILYALNRLLQTNDGAGFRFCRSDPATRSCLDRNLGYFVLGGLVLPGRGSSSSGKLREVKLDATTKSIQYVMSMDLSFLGIPLVCAEHGAVLAVRAVDDIVITDNPYLCNWMVVGIMTASFSFVIDSIDLDQGRLGGYWRHAVTGTGMGRGHGYALIEFASPMLPGEDWLTRK